MMKEEIGAELKITKKGKARGGDGIAAEILEAVDKFGIKTMTEIANTIFSTRMLTKECINQYP